ncbi:hypothetical protein AAFF_G00311880 [Aldrovandia affinis]|uniref:Uncharacterized protein n=1 Tax=Aldrovandia affinis TaxID=143900 RepID=A0AAD7SND4_9TELE|nr:hypothetical protein AAFF_G00311880 [Aldrovandia affinis]
MQVHTWPSCCQDTTSIHLHSLSIPLQHIHRNGTETLGAKGEGKAIWMRGSVPVFKPCAITAVYILIIALLCIPWRGGRK